MFRKLCAAAVLALAASPVLAHVTLETGQAPVKSAYKGVLRVGHGCEGSPTRTIKVQIPEGVISAKPMPKPGWTVSTTRGAYAKTYDYYGTPMAEGVKEITWTGGSLPDDQYDEFVFRANITDGLSAGTTLYFPVVQECEKGVHRWIEIPAAGKSADDYKEPAPGVKLLPAAQTH